MTQPTKEFNLPPPLMLLKFPYEKEFPVWKWKRRSHPRAHLPYGRRIRSAEGDGAVHRKKKTPWSGTEQDLDAEPGHKDLVPAMPNRNNSLEEWSCLLFYC